MFLWVSLDFKISIEKMTMELLVSWQQSTCTFEFFAVLGDSRNELSSAIFHASADKFELPFGGILAKDLSLDIQFSPLITCVSFNLFCSSLSLRWASSFRCLSSCAVASLLFLSSLVIFPCPLFAPPVLLSLLCLVP